MSFIAWCVWSCVSDVVLFSQWVFMFYALAAQASFCLYVGKEEARKKWEELKPWKYVTKEVIYMPFDVQKLVILKLKNCQIWPYFDSWFFFFFFRGGNSPSPALLLWYWHLSFPVVALQRNHMYWVRVRPLHKMCVHHHFTCASSHLPCELAFPKLNLH